MGKPNPVNPGYVTRAECAKTVRKFNGELKTIKKALVGGDMRGGLVKDVGDMKATLNQIDKWRRQEEASQQSKGRDWVDIAKKLGTGVAIVIFTYLLTTFG